MTYTDKILITRPAHETQDQRKARESLKLPLPHVSYCVSREVKSTVVHTKENQK